MLLIEMSTQLWLLALIVLNDGSIKIHEKFGFKYSGTVTKAGYKFGKWLDLVFYQLDLTGPKHPIEI